MKNYLLNYLKLNEDQANVILDNSKELLVPASAGSGKTKTLVTKVVQLLRSNVPLESFLVLTFTNKAASEMKERIKKDLKDAYMEELINKIDSSDISTFDAFAYKFVKQNAALIGLDSNLELLEPNIFKLKKVEILEKYIYKIMQDENHYFYDFIMRYSDKTNEASLINDLIALYEKLTLIAPLKSFKSEELIKMAPIFSNYEISQKLQQLSYEFFKKNENQISYYFTLADVFEGRKEINIYEKGNFNWRMFDGGSTSPEAKEIKELFKPYFNLEKSGATYNDYWNAYETLKEEASLLLKILKEYEKLLIQFKKTYNMYEFSDIASFLNNILKENSVALKRLKETYKYVFVDEYQDTSLVQSEFLEMLIKDNKAIKVLYVGDIKQSIYKFRDAKPESFIAKQQSIKTIPLTINYRSAPNIIDFVNSLFYYMLNDKEKYDIKYDEEHIMLSGNDVYAKGDNDADVFVLEVFSESGRQDIIEEAFIIGKKILELQAQNKIKSLDEITILSRNKTVFKHFKEVFEYLNIPLEILMDFNLEETYLLKLIANLLNLSLNFKNKEAFEKNRFNYLSIARSELFNYSDYFLFESLIDKGKKILNIDESVKEKLAKVNQAIYTRSNSKIIDLIVEEFNIYPNIIKTPKIVEKELQLDYLYEFSKTLSSLNIVGEKFVSEIEKLAYNKDVSIGVPILSNTKEKSVKITNIHQSKGLEYEILFLCQLNKKFTKEDIKQFKYTNVSKLLFNKKTTNEKEDLLYKLIKDKGIEDEFKDTLKEEMRLLYVALTRAKRALYLVTTPKSNANLLNSYNDYLYVHNFLNYIKTENITTYSESVKEEDYFLNLTNKSFYYPASIDSLKEVNLNVKKELISKHRASNKIKKLISEQEKQNLKTGTKLHEEFEYGMKLEETLFKHKFNNRGLKDAILYKELQYSYYANSVNYRGIIDLVAVYDEEVFIIDYKTKNIDKETYKNQFKNYYDYLGQIYPHKTIRMYIYSIVDDIYEEVIV